MIYKFAPKANYEDFASGRVLYHMQGFTNFPVRLICEVFMRCFSLINKPSAVVYDPCCGSGYMLTVLKFLYGSHIDTLIASDVSEEAVNLTKKNFGLLSHAGLDMRKEQLQDLHTRFKRDSYLEAIKSAERLKGLIGEGAFESLVFKRDILVDKSDYKADLILCDVPYGIKTAWSGEGDDFINRMLDNVWDNLNAVGVAAIFSDKKQKIITEKYKRAEKVLIGKRKFEIYVKLK